MALAFLVFYIFVATVSNPLSLPSCFQQPHNVASRFCIPSPWRQELRACRSFEIIFSPINVKVESSGGKVLHALKFVGSIWKFSIAFFPESLTTPRCDNQNTDLPDLYDFLLSGSVHSVSLPLLLKGKSDTPFSLWDCADQGSLMACFTFCASHLAQWWAQN